MKEFTEYLQSRSLSKTTIGLYSRYVNGFLDWYKKEPINCQKKDVLKYLSFLKDKKQYQNITRRNILIALNHYFTALLKNELVTSNPTAFLKIRGANKKHLYNTFSFEELTELADNYYHTFVRSYEDNHIPKNQKNLSKLSKERNYVMLSLLLNQGLATNELQNIRLDDLDLTKASIKITGKKKSNQRNIPLEASQIGAFMHYIQNIRPQLLEYQKSEDNEILFLPLPEAGRSKAQEENDLLGVMKNLSKQVKTLQANFINFRQIRASVITHWIKTFGLRKAQYFAGHRYISSTENYLPNDLESLTEDITKFNPF
jgi:site-specific recombinase XerD